MLKGQKRPRKADDKPDIKEQIALQRGGIAEVVKVWNDRIQLNATKPWAPGARVEGQIKASGTIFRMKVFRMGMKDGHPVLDARLLDATRSILDEFAALYESRQSTQEAPMQPPQETSEQAKQTPPG